MTQATTARRRPKPCSLLWAVACLRAVLLIFPVSGACIPDLGEPIAPVDDAGADGDADADADSDGDTDADSDTDADGDADGDTDGDGDADGDSDADGDGDGDADGDADPLCDDSPPSEEVDRYVWAENFTFFFTPAGSDIFTLYVPANGLVHFSLAGSLNEEVHIFQIMLPECNTPEVGMGTEGNEVSYDWKAPRVPGTYVAGGRCANHGGMEFDIVVEE
ncbi:MAG: hypothetical protein HYY06_05485 [Deltaproteobacteria bacterium]|nr:hypothetical protein [Deltaproteobacteria bacterium]